MTEYSDYIPINDSVGILSKINGQAPELVLAQRLGIELLVDERILGSWYLQDSTIPNIVLSKDGTASVTASPRYTKNGQFQWVTQNIIIITYTDQTQDVMRFDILVDNVAVITIIPHNSEDNYIIVGQKRSAIYQLTKMEN